MNKRILYVVFFSLFLTTVIYSQNRESHEKIRALKVAYLTEQLDLSPKEAQQFWPIYNKYDKKTHQLRSEMRSKMRKAYNHKKELGKISEDESKELVENKLSKDKELLILEEKFIKDIRVVISYQKILKLQIAEMDFGRKLMRKYRNRRD